MTLETMAAVVGAIAAVLSLGLKLYEKYPRFLRACIESLVVGIPFYFIPRHLIIAIILFTLNETYNIFKEARKPNLSVVDAFCAMGLLCLHSGVFAAFVVYVRL